MKDYKHSTKSLRALKSELERAFSDVNIRKKKKVSSKIFRISMLTVIITFLASATIFITTHLFSRDTKQKTKVVDCSYIGNIKIREEFNDMENSLATGGRDLSVYQKDDPDLKFFFYKVKKGESISTIANKLNVNMDTLISLNSMANAHTISVGKRILVPNLKGVLYSAKKGDTLSTIAKANNINVEDILDANDLDSKTIHRGDILFLPGAKLSAVQRAKALGYMFYKPLRGRFTSGYGIRRHPISRRMRFHSGIDIAARYGSRIRSAKEGRIVYSGWKAGYGKCVIIKHQFGYSTLYGHMSRTLVRKGQYVKAYQSIGKVGSTGNSTGPHLHFEVRKYGRPTNPLRYSGLRKARGRYY